jgi:hypothetical protein
MEGGRDLNSFVVVVVLFPSGIGFCMHRPLLNASWLNTFEPGLFDGLAAERNVEKIIQPPSHPTTLHGSS